MSNNVTRQFLEHTESVIGHLWPILISQFPDRMVCEREDDRKDSDVRSHQRLIPLISRLRQSSHSFSFIFSAISSRLCLSAFSNPIEPSMAPTNLEMASPLNLGIIWT